MRTTIDPETQRSLPALLAVLRRRAGLTGNELGLLAGYDHSFIVRLENGERAASRSTLLHLAEALALTGDATDALLLAGGYLPKPRSRSSLFRKAGLPPQGRTPARTLDSRSCVSTRPSHDNGLNGSHSAS